MTPVEVDILFKETVQQLKVSPSERIRLNLIDQFIDAIAGFEKNYQSYLIQLVEELPSLPNPLLFAGIHPSNLQGFIRRLETACTSISELKKNEFLDSRIDEYKSVLEQIMQWLGASTLEEEVQTKLVESKAAKISIIPGEVIVPVVEEFNGITAGRLRRLKVEIIGHAKEGHELKPNFGIVGAEIGNFAKTVESAVLALANESEGTRHQCWKASVQFELPHAWHTGSSANLAMAGAFFGEQMKAEEQQELFWLNPAACITGDLDKQGNVLPVNPQTIPQKIDAAFFSWCQLLIVPSEQLAEVHEQLAELNTEFPNRRLPVVGVSHLRELFYDRRVTLYKKETTLAHNAKKAWRRRKSVGAISLIATLILVISSLVYGPVDRNPSYATFEGEEMHIRNKNGLILQSNLVGAKVVKNQLNPLYRPPDDLIKFFDVNDDGVNEVLESKFKEDQYSIGSDLILYNLEGDTLWQRDFYLDIEFDNHPNIKADYFNLLKFDIVDIDKDGDYEIAATLRHLSYFTTLFLVMDIKTGVTESTYIGSGIFRDFMITDLDSDSINEVMLSGYIKSHDKNSIIVLDARFLGGNGILGERYKRSKGESAIEKAVILLPNSTIAKYYSSFQNWSKHPGHVRINIDKTIIADNYEYAGPNVETPLFTIYEFYDDLTIRAISASDAYDSAAEELFESKLHSINADARYLNSLSDSIKYWNGLNFQNEPTLNNDYINALEADTALFADFYFRHLKEE